MPQILHRVPADREDSLEDEEPVQAGQAFQLIIDAGVSLPCQKQTRELFVRNRPRSKTVRALSNSAHEDNPPATYVAIGCEFGGDCGGE